MSAVFYTLSISLFDSLSTTQQIIVFVLLLTTAKPLRNAVLSAIRRIRTVEGPFYQVRVVTFTPSPFMVTMRT
jgi:hypothetical protein